MADGRHYGKTLKSLYLSNRLTDFDEIWHAGADWPHTGGRSLKFPIFQKNKMAAAAILKNHKNRDNYHNNGLADLREIWHEYAKWVS